MKDFLINNTRTFMSLLAKIHEGVIIHAQDTSILYANPSASEILGLSRDELLGRNISDYDIHFINEDYERIDIKDYPVNRLFDSNKSIEHQLMGIYLSESNLKWIDFNGSITLGEDGEKIALIIISDVTERKNAYDEAELFKHLVDVVDTGITISDPYQADEPLIYTNKAFTKITGYTKEESLGKNCRFLQEDDTKQDAIGVIREHINSQKSCEVELRNYTKDGELFYNLLNISPLFEKEKLKYFVGVQHDITKQKLQEELLKERNLYIQSILDAQNGMVFVNYDKSIIFANKGLYEFFGFDSIESFFEAKLSVCDFFIDNDRYFHISKLKDDENWINALCKLPEEKRVVSMQDQNKKINYFKISIKEIIKAEYVITLNNITQEIEKELLLTSKAYRDPLTKAYNRQYFYEYIAPKTVNSDITFGLIMSDIDDFKSINDTYGHGVGDEVIKTLVNTIESLLSSTDTLIRWGGEEFVSIVEVASIDEAETIAQTLREAIEKIELKDVRKFTSSFGVTILNRDENIDIAIQRADEALYIAKANGKNRVEVR